MVDWNCLDSREQFSAGALFRLRCDKVRRGDTGSLHDVYVLESQPWVNVVPLTADGQVLLIRQYRHGTREYTWEVPGGLVEPGEQPEQAARRELREETGYSPARLGQIGTLAANPAIQSNRVHLFVAEDCQLQGEKQLDAMEDIQVRAVPVDSLLEWVQSGAITHAIAVAAVLMFLAGRQS